MFVSENDGTLLKDLHLKYALQFIISYNYLEGVVNQQNKVKGKIFLFGNRTVTCFENFIE